MTRAKSDAWQTSDEIAAAIGVTAATVRNWARQEVLPAPELARMGRRGNQARWPLHTADQARWVLSKLEAGFTFAEIRSMLAKGEFRPPSNKPGDNP